MSTFVQIDPKRDPVTFENPLPQAKVCRSFSLSQFKPLKLLNLFLDGCEENFGKFYDIFFIFVAQISAQSMRSDTALCRCRALFLSFYPSSPTFHRLNMELDL